MEQPNNVKRISDWDFEQLRSLAQKHDTPLYVADIERIRDNYNRFIEQVQTIDEIRYAVKANSRQYVLETLREEGANVECGSAGEIYKCLTAGFEPEEIQYTAVNPPTDNLQFFIENCGEESLITVGALSTLERLQQFGYSGDVCVRFRPDESAGHHEKVETGKNLKFGVSQEELDSVISWIQDSEMNFIGLHSHMGSGLLNEDLNDYEKYIRTVSEVAERYEDELEFVDLGGGFGVPYHPSEKPLDLAKVSMIIGYYLDEFEFDVIAEPGRFIVADSEILLTTVNTVKESKGKNVIGVDAGMTTLIRPAMYDSYHHMENLSVADNRDYVDCLVGGPICENSDVFHDSIQLLEPQIDDILAIGNVGAYGYEMANVFHSQPRPKIVSIQENTIQTEVERESFEDLVQLENRI